MRAITALLGLSLLLTACVTPYGATPSGAPVDAKPDLEQAKAKAEIALRGTLKDPASAQFQNWSPVHMTQYGLLRREWVWAICVDVNGKNSYGGYTGFTTYQVHFANGEVRPEPAAIMELEWGCKAGYLENRQ